MNLTADLSIGIATTTSRQQQNESQNDDLHANLL